MNDTKTQEPASSTESPTTTATESRGETLMSAESPEAAKAPHQAQPSRYNPVIINSPKGADSQFADFVAFLKRTWRIWAIAIGTFAGLILVVALLQKLTEMAKVAEQRRFEKAIASVTPEHLIARCGQPAEDVSKEVFPVVMRTIRYERGRSEKLLLTFSKTAEQQSDWVFLTMKDENGTGSFDTPESKILALSCLDSTK
jgi:hypothetical protein